MVHLFTYLFLVKNISINILFYFSLILEFVIKFLHDTIRKNSWNRHCIRYNDFRTKILPNIMLSNMKLRDSKSIPLKRFQTFLIN